MAQEIKLCSACLLGVRCRYNGKSKPNEKILEMAKSQILIPVCPEQLGGLPTPREATELVNGKVMTKSGNDVSDFFEQGAEEALRIAQILNIKEAIMKQESPSCGYGLVHDGTFSEEDKLIEGNGITADLLSKNGIKITAI